MFSPGIRPDFYVHVVVKCPLSRLISSNHVYLLVLISFRNMQVSKIIKESLIIVTHLINSSISYDTIEWPAVFYHPGAIVSLTSTLHILSCFRPSSFPLLSPNFLRKSAVRVSFNCGLCARRTISRTRRPHGSITAEVRTQLGTDARAGLGTIDKGRLHQGGRGLAQEQTLVRVVA